MPVVDSIYRNPGRWRAVIHTHDVRHGTAGCLLSLVLLAPLFVRQFGMVTIATAVLTYSLVIVPALTNYFSPIKMLMKLFRGVKDACVKVRAKFNLNMIKSAMKQMKSEVVDVVDGFFKLILLLINILTLPFVCFFYCFLYSIHGFYVVLEGFRTTSNQIVFFMLCEKFLCPEARLSSLYFLLFYTVLAYLHKSLLTRQWSQSFYETNIHDFLKLTTWFIAVRLAKGVAMAFVLIIFTMQFNNVEPDIFFIAITFTYFVLTQRKWTGNEVVVSWFRRLQIDSLEEEEDYWIPFYLKIIPISMSVIFMGVLIFYQNILCAIATYTNILVPIQLLKKEFDDRNLAQTVSLMSFQRASKEDLAKNPICPICLDTMRVARVTPCRHVYHAVCLRKCLTLSTFCPMCKRSLASSIS